MAPGAARIRRTAHRRPVRPLPAAHQPLRLHEPPGGGHQPHRRLAVPPHPPGCRTRAVDRAGLGGTARRRNQGTGHRPPPRNRLPGLLRTARRQAVVLPPRLHGRLRRVRRGVPRLTGSDRPLQRAGPRMGRLPPLRRPQRLGARRHGRRRGLASDLPGVGDALLVSRRRGDRGPPSVLPGGRQDEGAAAGGEPGRPLRLHRPLPGPGPPGSGRRGPAGRAHAEEPPGRTGARLLHDAGAALRQPRHGPPAHAGRGTRRCSRGHVPVRALDRHRRLLARPHAPRPGRASQRAAGLRAVFHHRPPQGDGDEGPEPQLCRHALHPRSRIG